MAPYLMTRACAIIMVAVVLVFGDGASSVSKKKAALTFVYPSPASTLPSSALADGFEVKLNIDFEHVNRTMIPEDFMSALSLCTMFSHISAGFCTQLNSLSQVPQWLNLPAGTHHAVAWVQGLGDDSAVAPAYTSFTIPQRATPLVSVMGCEGTGHNLAGELWIRDWKASNSLDYYFQTASYPYGMPPDSARRPDITASRPDRVLLLWREPRGAIRSVARRRGTAESLVEAAMFFIDNMDAIFAQLEQSSGVPVLRVDFSIATKRPREVASDVAAFLGLELPTPPTQLSNATTSSAHVPLEARVRAPHPGALEPLGVLLEGKLRVKRFKWEQQLARQAPNIAGVARSSVNVEPFPIG